MVYSKALATLNVRALLPKRATHTVKRKLRHRLAHPGTAGIERSESLPRTSPLRFCVVSALSSSSLLSAFQKSRHLRFPSCKHSTGTADQNTIFVAYLLWFRGGRSVHGVAYAKEWEAQVIAYALRLLENLLGTEWSPRGRGTPFSYATRGELDAGLE